MFMLNSNEPIKDAHLQKLANQSMLNGALVIEMVNASKEARKTLLAWECVECSNKKIEVWAVKNISPLGLAKYLSYSEVQKNRKVVNVWIRFQQVGSLF